MSSPSTMCNFGACGTGKSYGLSLDVRAELDKPRGKRFIVLDLSDPKHPDWPGGPCKGVRHARVSTLEGVRLALASGERLVIVSPADTSAAAVAPLGDELAMLTYDTGGVTLVLPEVHTIAPQKGDHLPDGIERLAHRYRHAGVGLWVDSQYTQNVSKRLWRACELVNWYAMGAGASVNLAGELHRDIPDDVRTISRLVCGTGVVVVDPGWHVQIPKLVPEDRVIISPSGEVWTPEAAAAKASALRGDL